jgi:hypothetical protein
MSYSLLNADRATHRKILAVATAATVAFVIVGATARIPPSGPALRASGETFFENGHINMYAKVPTKPSSRFDPSVVPPMPLRFAQNQPPNEGALRRGAKQDRLSFARNMAVNSVAIRNDPDLNTTYAARHAPAIELKTRKTVVCESPFGGAVALTDLDVFVRCVAEGIGNERRVVAGAIGPIA